MGTTKLLQVVLCIRLGFGVLRFQVPEASMLVFPSMEKLLEEVIRIILVPINPRIPSTSFPIVHKDRFPEGFVGEFIVVNNMEYPGGGGVQEYLQRKWLGETYDHDPFVLDTNGTLLTNRLLDFEADEQNQTFQIIASTGTKQSLPQEFIVSITDVEEDLDGDGVEDFYDSDSDGDGLSNLHEFHGRSDPMNSSSSNAAPSEINVTGSLSFSESLALG